MALAHLGQWSSARAALKAGRRQCPEDKRFPIELAGVAFEQKDDAEAAAWLRRGLKLDPKDRYANNFAGTVYYLMGNVPAALHYWNRIGKPEIDALHLDSGLKVHRLLLSRAFAFSPAAVLKQSQLAATKTQLDALGIFPTYRIVLNARPDGAFDADFHATELDGFGHGILQPLISVFSGLPYETVYPNYYNLGRSAINVESLLRWDDQKRRAWARISGPLHDLPSHRWAMWTDLRNEDWLIRRSESGSLAPLGSLNLERQIAGTSVRSLNSGRLEWTVGTEVSHRSYRRVVYGTALQPGLLSPGYGLDFLASMQGVPVDVPQRRFEIRTGVRSETGRVWSSPAHLFEKLQGSATARWFPRAASDNWELQQRFRAGRIEGTAPFDRLFVLGLERDTNLWMRGILATKDGEKGSGPTGNGYVLANSDLYRKIYSNGLIGVDAGPLLDIGRAWAPTAGLAPREWLFDTGIEARLSVLGTSVVLSWGRDLRTGGNVFWGTAGDSNP